MRSSKTIQIEIERLTIRRGELESEREKALTTFDKAKSAAIAGKSGVDDVTQAHLRLLNCDSLLDEIGAQLEAANTELATAIQAETAATAKATIFSSCERAAEIVSQLNDRERAFFEIVKAHAAEIVPLFGELWTLRQTFHANARTLIPQINNFDFREESEAAVNSLLKSIERERHGAGLAALRSPELFGDNRRELDSYVELKPLEVFATSELSRQARGLFRAQMAATK